ncbi:LysR family transcriptional regulator [Noviherbaspirillum aridicola]|uniref:Transcriptional regulator n=1 Tax=Noviherbaspirillum aridicola TaxID=2849687 RepID=A0ABQ4Q4Z4_9BURK|nr:LysR family transcriptional regulator [Noviherbaspirillum aridicola]GIZ52259.1 transcriptional regulator [Noviherbaspirillum aridicola]
MKASHASLQSAPDPADLALLLALVRGRTLAAAAARLGVDTSTVFRSIRRLERRLGGPLFERGRQGYAPTELARMLALHAERIESQLQEAREAVWGRGGEAAGLLRITTTDTLLNGLLLPALSRFARLHPGIELELLTANALANLSQRDADVALRATRTPPEHVVGTRLGTLPSGVYAARAYLDGREAPLRLEEADWIALDDSLADHPSARWRRQQYPKLRPRIRCNSVLSVAGAIVNGFGVGVSPCFLLQAHPAVEMIGEPVPALETGLWMLAHPEVRHWQRVRLLFDFLRDELRPRLG